MATNPAPSPRIISLLKGLAHSPPWVIIFEGGDEQQRDEVALYWCALVNCSSSTPPCGRCTLCEEIFTRKQVDVHIIEGEKNIKIEDVHVISTNMPERPKEARYRCFILKGAHRLTPAAANFLLKTLEEPLPGNLFVLLTPHRSMLLPTLISRSHILTLAWKLPSLEKEAPEITEAIETIARFLRSQRGIFSLTEKKLDPEFVRGIILGISTRLILSLSREKSSRDGLIEVLLEGSLSPLSYWRISQVLERAQEMLEQNIRPSRVLEWMCIKLACTI